MSNTTNNLPKYGSDSVEYIEGWNACVHNDGWKGCPYPGRDSAERADWEQGFADAKREAANA